MNYTPPFTITSEILTLVAKIAETAGRLSAASSDSAGLRLRRTNRIRTIQRSLAIEGNTLTEEQITANSAPFITFMLTMINEAVEQFSTKTGQVRSQNTGQVAEPVKKLISFIKESMTTKEIMTALSLKGRDNFLKLYLNPALAQKLIERTISDKPKSKMQKYRLTDKGKAFSNNGVLP